MKPFKKSKGQRKTRIFHIKRTQDIAPLPALVPVVVQTPRWEVRREEFQGFDSPPGRF